MEEEIDLKVIFDAIWSKKIIIISVAIIFAIAGYIYSKVLVTPKYTATAKMLLVSGNSNNLEAGITTSDVSLNNNLIDTYKELARSNTIVREILNNLQITDLSEESLREMIDVTSTENTQILYVSITDTDKYRATKVTNELTKVFAKKVEEFFNIENINVVDEAEVPEYPSNINTSRTMMIFFLLGLTASIIVVLLINMLDNTVKTSKDIEKAIRVPVLAELPQCDFTENSVKRRRK